MKLIQNLKKHLPVSRKTHEEALKQQHAAHQADQAYLTGQLRQVTAHNLRLESRIHGDHEGSEV